MRRLPRGSLLFYKVFAINRRLITSYPEKIPTEQTSCITFTTITFFDC